MEKGEKKIKLCYILPEFSKDLDNHIFYLHDFISQAAEGMDIFLIIEKSNFKKIDGSFKYIKIQRFQKGLLRWVENFYYIFIARISGYKNFYTHYSYFGAINSIIITKIFGGWSYYWSCGMMWLCENPLSFKWAVIRTKLIVEWPLRFILKNIDFLVTGNKAMKRGYGDHYKLPENKIKIMPNWIDLERFDPDKFDSSALRARYDIPLQKKVVLFVHHLSERKGADLIVPIAENLKSDEGVLFIVCGSGPYKGKLEKEIEAKGLQGNIRLEGAVPNKIIPEYFAISDVLLMPSREEGFPRVLLEAMAMNIPYVASNVGGVPDITPGLMKKNICKEALDVACYVERLRASLDSNDNNYRNEVKKYSKDRVIRHFIDLFNT